MAGWTDGCIITHAFLPVYSSSITKARMKRKYATVKLLYHTHYVAAPAHRFKNRRTWIDVSLVELTNRIPFFLNTWKILLNEDLPHAECDSKRKRYILSFINWKAAYLNLTDMSFVFSFKGINKMWGCLDILGVNYIFICIQGKSLQRTIDNQEDFVLMRWEKLCSSRWIEQCCQYPTRWTLRITLLESFLAFMWVDLSQQKAHLLTLLKIPEVV